MSVTERDQPRPECVGLDAFLDACIASHAELATPKQIKLERASDGGDARFDSDQMRRALDNLVLNAIHAAPAGNLIRVAAMCGAEGLVLSVHDGGAGPPADIRDHLFEPFVTGRPLGPGLAFRSFAKWPKSMAGQRGSLRPKQAQPSRSSCHGSRPDRR